MSTPNSVLTMERGLKRMNVKRPCKQLSVVLYRLDGVVGEQFDHLSMTFFLEAGLEWVR